MFTFMLSRYVYQRGVVYRPGLHINHKYALVHAIHITAYVIPALHGW